MPDYEQGISVAGYHSHFIDNDHHPRRATHWITGWPAETVDIRRALRAASELAAHPRSSCAPNLDSADIDHQIRQTEGRLTMTDGEVRSAQRVVENAVRIWHSITSSVSPGAKIDPVFRCAGRRRPRNWWCVATSRNAAFMAAAVGRLTGTPGVALVTSGPGTTNLATGLITATTRAGPDDRDLRGPSAGPTGSSATHQSMDAVAAPEALHQIHRRGQPSRQRPPRPIANAHPARPPRRPRGCRGGSSTRRCTYQPKPRPPSFNQPPRTASGEPHPRSRSPTPLP